MAKMCSQLAETLKTIVPFEGENDVTPMPNEILSTRLTVLLITAVSAAKFYGQPFEFLEINVRNIYERLKTPSDLNQKFGETAH